MAMLYHTLLGSSPAACPSLPLSSPLGPKMHISPLPHHHLHPPITTTTTPTITPTPTTISTATQYESLTKRHMLPAKESVLFRPCHRNFVLLTL